MPVSDLISIIRETHTPPNAGSNAPSPARKYYSAADYRELYISGELTPTAVAKAILPLIRRDTKPPGEHSIAWFDSRIDLILLAAEASTLRYKEKRSIGPLDGVPTAVKDEYDVDGYTTCLGSKNDYTGEVVSGKSITSWCAHKLEESGAINLGKLSMHEFGLGMCYHSEIQRRTLNIYRYVWQQPNIWHSTKSI